MILVAVHITLCIRQHLVQRGFVECRFDNKRLEIIKYMEVTFPNAEKLNIRG